MEFSTENRTLILKDLKDKIQNLHDTEKKEVFKLMKDNVKYSKNSNGVFINMNLLDDNVIIELMEFLEFINKNNEMLLQREKDYENTQQS